MKCHSLIAIVVLCILALFAQIGLAAERPNIVLILCDDLGYGDVQCLNPEFGKIKTPCIDQIAAKGMIFTDAHSGSSVCTPTRYGLLTGRYSWRTPLQRGVVQGFAPCVIQEGRPTLSSFLKSKGYTTGLVGKWHLNMRFFGDDGTELKGKKHKFTAPVGATVKEGPIDRGFDYFFGIHHARSMKAIIQGNQVTEHAEVIDFLPRCSEESVKFIETHSKTAEPFFLYVPLGSPHTPIVPTPEWQGKSGLNKYADFVMQTDHVVGEIMNALDDTGVADNTLVLFSSDNGCSKAANIKELLEKGHRVSGIMRGSKADIWDGGHRVPFLVRWPGKVEAGSRCDQLVCMTDVFATTAEILETQVPNKSCEDSVSFYPAFFGKTIESSRKGVIHHSFSGHFAYREKNWKLILARGSGGWTSPKENESHGEPEAQLYNLEVDPTESRNLYKEEPDLAGRLLQQLKDDVYSGRSTTGPKSENDFKKIKLWKSGEDPVYRVEQIPGLSAITRGALNNKNQVAGSDLDISAFFFSDGKTEQIAENIRASWATDINDQGTVVGFLFSDGSGARQAFTYSCNKLEILEGIENPSQLIGINNANVVIYTAEGRPQTSFSYCNGVVKEIGRGELQCISDTAVVLDGNSIHQVLKTGETIPIETPSNPRVDIRAINARGNLAGLSSYRSSKNERGSVLFVFQNGKWEGTRYPNGVYGGHFFSINSNGDVVVGRGGYSLLYTNGNLHRIQSLLDSSGDKTTIDFAYDINDHGVILAGGKQDGKDAVFLLHPVSKAEQPSF